MEALRPINALALQACAAALAAAGLEDVPIEYANFGVDDRIDAAAAGVGTIVAGASTVAAIAFPFALVGVAVGAALFARAVVAPPVVSLAGGRMRCPPGFSVRRCIALGGLRVDHVVYLTPTAFDQVAAVLKSREQKVA